MFKLIEALLRSIGRGPVYRQASQILRRRIQQAEKRFATDILLRENLFERERKELERQLVEDTKSLLEAHADSIFG